MRFFPNQNIPESKKDQTTSEGRQWAKEVGDYAEYLIELRRVENERITKAMDRYNGDSDPKSVQWLTQYYGKKYKSKYRAYRQFRTKLELMLGEFLKRPLAGTVQTINLSAQEAKASALNTLKGAAVAKDEINELRGMGLNILEGMPVPESEEDEKRVSMSVKDTQETIMQIIINNQIVDNRLQFLIYKNFRDIFFAGRCHAVTTINQEGDAVTERIDPRDAIFEEIEDDDFLKRSRVKGRIYPMTINEILAKYGPRMDDSQKRLVEQMRENPDKYTELSRGRVRIINNQAVIDVMHINWKSQRKEYYKLSPKTKSQSEIGSPDDKFEIELQAEAYEKAIENNPNHYEGQEIKTKYREDEWEMTRIGGLIDVDVQRKKFQMRRMDSPAYIYDTSYTGYLHNTINGRRVTLCEIGENIDMGIDVVTYQIFRDIAKFKGKAIFYDRSYTPKGTTIEKVMYGIAESGYVDVSSSAFLNDGGRDVDITTMLKEIDLGLSSSFGPLVQFRNELINMLDRLTGINESREGAAPASATVTNNQQNLTSSRNITAFYFYGIDMYTEELLTKVCESTKVSWAFYKIEKGKQILGIDKWNLLEVTQELGYRDYSFKIQDGSKYAALQEDIKGIAQAAINSGEIRLVDYYKMRMAETFAEQRNILENGWKIVKETAAKQQQMANESNERMNQAKIEAGLTNMREDREDRQGHEGEMKVLQGDIDIKKENTKAFNKMHENKQKSDDKVFEEKK